MTRRTEGSVYATLARLGSSDITVRQDRCIMVRNRNARCGLCADACASGCIAYEDGSLSIDLDQCIGCGTCATVCPTCALEARDPSDAELLARCVAAPRTPDGPVAIACERADVSGEAGGPTVVACLGRVEESLVVELVARGAGGVVLFSGACDECPHVNGRHACEQVCASANELLRAWGSAARASIREVASVQGALAGGLGDRLGRPSDDGSGNLHAADALDGDAAGEPAAVPPGDDTPAPKPRYLKVMADGTLPHFIPDRRERLLDALATLGEPADVGLSTRLTGHVEIDLDACTSCRLCATFCPTGAISKFDDEDGAFGLLHTPGDCVRCRCCEKVCRPRAIRVVDGVAARDLLGGVPQRIELRPVGLHKGTSTSMRDTLRVLLGMEEVFER